LALLFFGVVVLHRALADVTEPPTATRVAMAAPSVLTAPPDVHVSKN